MDFGIVILEYNFTRTKENSAYSVFTFGGRQLHHAYCFLTKQKKKTPDSGFLACDLTNTGIMSSVPKSKRPHQQDPWLIIAKMLNVFIEQLMKCMQDQGCFAALVDRVSQSSVQLHEQDY